MLPYLIKTDTMTIGTYGLMLAIAYLTGRWFYLQELQRIKPIKANAEWLIILLLALGVAGAKLMFVLKNPDRVEGVAFHGLFSGTGFSSQGALLGAMLATWIFSRFSKVPLSQLLDAAAPAAILAYAIARVGCFLSGDDCYGIASDLPWAIAYPNGIAPTTERVHPIPLYEIIYSLVIFVYLIKHRQNYLTPYKQFFVLLLSWGFCRFWIEFISINPIKIWGMTGSQFGALLMFLAAMVYFAKQMSGKEKKLAR